MASVAASAQTLTTIVSFDLSNGANPTGPLLRTSDGTLFGTTFGLDAEDAGTVFAISPAGELHNLHVFHIKDGYAPTGSLVLSGGVLYGATAGGGIDDYGDVFKVALSATPTFTRIHDFTGSPDGQQPESGLFQASNGKLYGSTYRGGEYGYGAIYSVEPSGAVTILHNFDNTDGATPVGTMIQGTDKNLYGTTTQGGPAGCGYYGCGTVFKISPTGALTTIHFFTPADIGNYPYSLIQGTDGNFYGTTYYGGPEGSGVIFKLTPAGEYSVLHVFLRYDGQNPQGAMLEGANGVFYGTTSTGGIDNFGTIYQIDGSGAFAKLHDFVGTDGQYPEAALIQAPDGSFYSTTAYGGSVDGGTVFRFTLP